MDALDAALEERPDIIPADRAALRDIVRAQLARADVRVPYERMSRQRRQRVNDRIRHVVSTFPKGHEHVEARRAHKLKQLRGELEACLNMPVFAPGDTGKLDQQLAVLADWMSEQAKRLYPVIVGSAIPDLVKARALDAMRHYATDDMSPFYKHPLPDEQFSSLIASWNKQAEGLDPIGAGRGGHFTRKWGQMDDATRAQYLKDNSRRVVRKIMMSFDGMILEAGSRYGRAATATHYKHIDLAELMPSQEQTAALRAELVEVEAESQRAMEAFRKKEKEEWELRKRLNALLAGGRAPDEVEAAVSELLSKRGEQLAQPVESAHGLRKKGEEQQVATEKEATVPTSSVHAGPREQRSQEARSSRGGLAALVAVCGVAAAGLLLLVLAARRRAASR